MRKSTKLQIRMSELRTEVNGLEAGDQNVAKRRELLAEIETAETEYRAALTAEAADEGAEHRGGDGLTAEERELRGLDDKAELRNVVNGDHQWARAVRRPEAGVPASPMGFSGI